MAPEVNSPTATAMPTHPFVSNNDHSSLLDVVGWFSIAVIVLIVLTRLGMRWAKSSSVGLDDFSIIGSTLFSIAGAATVSFGVHHGLGRRDVSTADKLVAQQKAIYIVTILFILSQFCAKLSIICFVLSLSPSKHHRRVCWCFMTTAGVWAVVSVFGFAFQCAQPAVWMFIGNKCFNRKAFYTFVEIFNSLLDMGLAFFPSIIIFGLQLDTKRKAITISFFMSRLLVVAASMTQLGIIYRQSEDPFLSWTFALLVTIIQALGILTACGPYLKPFLDSVNSGMIGNDDIRRRQGGTEYKPYMLTDSQPYRASESARNFGKSLMDSGAQTTQQSTRHENGSESSDGSELSIFRNSLTLHPDPNTYTPQIFATFSNDKNTSSFDRQSDQTRVIRQTTSYIVSSESQ